MSLSPLRFIANLFNEASHPTNGPKMSVTANQASRLKSVSAQFIEQLDQLIKNLNESTSLYIRCIKPNSV